MKKIFGALCTIALVATPAVAQKAQPPAKTPAAQPAPAQPAPEAAPTVEITVTAESALLRSDVPGSKQRAVELALRRAVEQVVGTYVTSFSETRQFELLSDLVATNTTGYVKTYEVVSLDVNEEDMIVTAKVKAQVGKAKLDADAAAVATLHAMKKERRLLVIINDRSVQTVGRGQAAQNVAIRSGEFDAALRAQLRNDGFVVLDPNLADGKLKMQAGIQSIDSAGQAVEYAKVTRADVVIYGNVSLVEEEPETLNHKVGRVTLSPELTVLFPNSSEIPAEFAKTYTATEFTVAGARRKAISQALAEALPQVRGQMYEAWRRQLTSGNRIELSVKGLKNYGAFKEFQALLSEHVLGVRELSSARFSSGVGSVDVAYQGTADALATGLG
ncbi:MAG: hypothetical protein ACK4N5_20865, partial [Myxococcales bacterium]